MPDSDYKKPKLPVFNNFGEYLFYAYANLQMLFYAISAEKPKYDQTCFKIRAKAFKAYKDGRWKIHDLLKFNLSKIHYNNFCWYCGCEHNPKELTIDHVFPRSKECINDMDNIIMVCKKCNSSKGKMDLFEWYFKVRKEWPPIPILVHYLKNIYFYSSEHDLMDMHTDEIDSLELPFNWRYIPLIYPQPEDYCTVIKDNRDK